MRAWTRRLVPLLLLAGLLLAPTLAEAAPKSRVELVLATGKKVRGELRSSRDGVLVTDRGKETLHLWRDVDRITHTYKEFVIESKATPETTARLAEAFERFMAAMPRTFGFKAPIRRNAIPQVRVFRSVKGFTDFSMKLTGEDSTEQYGWFWVTPAGIPLVAVLDDPWEPEETLDTMLHEGTHLLTSLWGAGKNFDLPVWIDEGMATYFGGSIYRPQSGSLRATFTPGALKPRMLSEVREQLAKDETIPLSQLLRLQDDGFTSENYGQAWSLVHYLAHHDGGKAAPLLHRYCHDLMRTVRTGERATELFTKVFRVKLDALEKDWKAYVRALEPANDAERLAFADRCIWDSRPSDAIALVEPLIARKPGAHRPLVVKALAKAFLRDYASAYELLDRAQELSPDDPEAIRVRGYISRYGLRWADAIEAYEKHLAAHPLDLPSVMLLMECHMLSPKPDPEKALALGEAVRAYHTDAKLLACMARASTMLGQHEQAVSLLREALSLRPEDKELEAALAAARKAAGKG